MLKRRLIKGAAIWLCLTVPAVAGMVYVAYGLWVLFWITVGGMCCCLLYLPFVSWFSMRAPKLLQVGFVSQIVFGVYCAYRLLVQTSHFPRNENGIFIFIGLLLLIGGAMTTGVLWICERRERQTQRQSVLSISGFFDRS